MKTRQQALVWMQQQVGKLVSWNGYTQCVALVRYYIQHLGYSQFPAVNGAANINDWSPDFQCVDDPQPGDIAVWAGTQRNPSGHTDLVSERFNDKLGLIGQNYIHPKLGGKDGSPTAGYYVSWPSQRSVKFYRPKFATPSSAPTPPVKTNDQLADEVIHGDWGNGADRKDRLTSAGHNYDAVQAIVNARTAASKPTPTSSDRRYTIQPGETYWSIETKFNIPHGTLEKINPWPAKQVPKFAQIKLP